MAQPQSISARDLRDRLDRGEAIQLVDVREDDELALARLPQAPACNLRGHQPLHCNMPTGTEGRTPGVDASSGPL